MGRKTDETTPSSYTAYTYDAAGQLTGDVRTGTGAYSISYTYDSAGNRATKVLGGVTENYTYDDANKLTATTGKSYSYDDAGNCTGVSWSGGSISLSWDAESRLKSETTGGTTVNYAFNGLGQRVGKSGGVSASYILADDSIDTEVLADGSASYAHGVTGLISENRGGTSKFYHPDALGSVRALTNTSGTVTDSRSTDAFGLVVASSGSTPTPFGFVGSAGYQQDSETGLMRLGHRMYDASTGRFISRDPIQAGYNWYAYCENDSVNAVDPSGLLDEKPGGGTLDSVTSNPDTAIAAMEDIGGTVPKPDTSFLPKWPPKFQIKLPQFEITWRPIKWEIPRLQITIPRPQIIWDPIKWSGNKIIGWISGIVVFPFIVGIASSWTIDTWKYSGGKWAQPTPSPSPSPSPHPTPSPPLPAPRPIFPTGWPFVNFGDGIILR